MLLGVAISLYRNKKLSDEQLPFKHYPHNGDKGEKKKEENETAETKIDVAYVPK